MKIALIDDDATCLSEMEAICRAFGTQNHCAMEIECFSSGEAFLDKPPDPALSLVFLDVYMGGLGGVETARRLRELGHGCLIVFLTSSTAFMPEAFTCHAFEYVTKPFTPRRIEGVLSDALKVTPDGTEYIEVLCERRTVRLLFGQIASISANAHYLDIGMMDGRTLRTRMSMVEFLERAGDARFLTVNKGVVLNADHILDFDDNICILENGTQFPIHLRNKRKIQQAVLDRRFEVIRRRQYLEKGGSL